MSRKPRIAVEGGKGGGGGGWAALGEKVARDDEGESVVVVAGKQADSLVVLTEDAFIILILQYERAKLRPSAGRSCLCCSAER